MVLTGLRLLLFGVQNSYKIFYSLFVVRDSGVNVNDLYDSSQGEEEETGFGARAVVSILPDVQVVEL